MENIDNYIYLDICEILYNEGFNKSKFLTFTSFCKVLKNSLDSNALRRNDYEIVFKICDYISLVYFLPDSEVYGYLANFLNAEEEIIFKFLLCVKSSEKITFSQ